MSWYPGSASSSIRIRSLAGIMYIHTWAQYSTMLRLIAKLEGFGHCPAVDPVGETQHERTVANTLVQFDAGHRNLAGLYAGRRIEGLPGRRRYLGAALHAYRVHSIEASDRARTMEGLLTSTLMLSGGASDLSNSEIGPFIDRYFRGGATTTRGICG